MSPEERQKTIDDNTSNNPFKFRAKNNWIGINDNSHGTCCTDSQINFKTAMLMSSLYDYSELNKYCMFYVHTPSFNITL